MPPDTYKVEIIHLLNPHLMWIEVTTSEKTELKFEQVGIYGILPLETTINIEFNNLESQESDKWLPAATTLIKQFLTESVEICFTPTYIDRRVSIFDDNIHKYGEFLIKTKNGKLKKLSKLLIKSGFAYNNEGLFHEKLISGKIVNRLENTEIQNVISQLERYYKAKGSPKKYLEKALKKQMSVFEFSQQLESALTESNLEKHNNLMLNKVLKNKMRDFEMCKDIEEDSLGRATTKLKDGNKEKPSNLIQNKTYDIIQSYNYMKKFLDVNSKKDESMKIDKNREQNYENQQDEASAMNLQDCKGGNKQTETITEDTKYSGYIDDDLGCRSNESCDNNYEILYDKTKKHSNKIHNENPLKSKNDTQNQVFESTRVCHKNVENNSYKNNIKEGNQEDGITDRSSISIRSNRLKKLNRNYNVIHEKRIAYGPPDLNKQKLKLDTIRVTEDLQIQTPIEDEVLEEEQCNIQQCEIDSRLSIDITNKIKLKEILNKAEIEKKLVPQSPNLMRNTVKGKENSSSSSSTLLQKKLRMYESTRNTSMSSSDTSNKDSSISEDTKHFLPLKKCESEEDISAVINRLNNKYNFGNEIVEEKCNGEMIGTKLKTNVNPFQNVDASISVFVDKLVKPILMVHSKLNSRIEPVHEMRDIAFNAHIRAVLKNMSIQRPMMLQTVSWFTILRGYSLFMISPKDSGKTLGYLPAVCRLVSDYNDETIESVGPIAIIVCATVKSVAYITMMANIFLGSEERVMSCYAGVNKLDITTRLLNGCDLLITTPSLLVWLLQDTDFGVDLKRLCTFVVDDCERISVVYKDELNISLYKIKETLKKRAHKEIKVQFILASRIWCSFMETLAKKAPDTVICIGAFQECVLYSKTNTSIDFVKIENKINHVQEFLNNIDSSKKTVIVCRSDDEVDLVSKALKLSYYTVFSCNNEMTVQDLHNINIAWIDYEEPLIGPILVSCDGNLIHMNVTNAHNLIHFSLPSMFSTFCKRFSVLIEHYPSIFKSDNETVKIKILLDDTNVDQMPKIINFIKRCTDNIPDVFKEICTRVLKEKDVVKAKNFVPVCNGMLSCGYCPDFYNCQERHAILKEYDTPQEWMPKNGLVTFTIIHCHTAVFYSARLKSHIVNGVTTDFRQTYMPLTIKLGLYYSKESNRKLHGIPQLGDICAAMIRQDLFMRCEVIKIINRYQRGNPNCVLVMLLDERKTVTTRDICLFHLPDDLKNEVTYAVQVRLANIQPKDKDITYSRLAKDHVRKIMECDNDVYVRGHICMTFKNCIFVDTLEVCHDLTSLKETVVRYNVRQELLENHAVTNLDHIPQLQKKCLDTSFVVKEDIQSNIVMKNIKVSYKGTWAYLDSDIDCSVFFASAISPDKFFVRLDKFESCMNDLVDDIQTYVVTADPVLEVKVGEMVLAKFPDDSTYERARIDDINKDKVKCFFVDHGDWREVSLNHLIPIPEKFVSKLPFQAIECRLIGLRPPGEEWTDFSINWLYDNSFDKSGNMKHLFVKYFTKEQAEFTGGHKYGVIYTDTNGEQDVVVNQLMINLNLARQNEEEIQYLNLYEKTQDSSTIASSADEEWEKVTANSPKTEESKISPSLLFQQPKRSVPLVGSDEESDDLDEWEVNMLDDFKALFPSCISNPQQNSSFIPTQKNEIRSIESVGTTKENETHHSDLSRIDSKDILKDTKSKISKIKEMFSDDITSSESLGIDHMPAQANESVDIPIKIQIIENIATLKESKSHNDSDISKVDLTHILKNTERDFSKIVSDDLISSESLAIDKQVTELENTCKTIQCNNSIILEENETSNDSDVSRMDSTDILKDSESELPKIKELDSDDMTSLETLRIDKQVTESTNTPTAIRSVENVATLEISETHNNSICRMDCINILKVTESEIPKIIEMDSDDLTSSESSKVSLEADIEIVIQQRRPKLLWRQNKKDVIVKIQLIGADYNLIIEDRALIFSANANETEYGFDFELYGVVDKSKCSHENKGQYILVRLIKVLHKNWLTLSRKGGIQKWILYDVDNIDTSSDEEEIDKKTLENVIKSVHNEVSESEDEEFYDDVNGSYK